jgi:amino-acid N-acetyltransferase
MGEELELRAATEDDLIAIAVLLAAEGLPPVGAAEGVSHFRVLAGAQGAVAGAGMELHGASALLRSVVVAPAWRSRGLAKRLTEEMVALARELGVDALYLLTMDANEYFAGQGFSPLPRDQAPREIQHTRQYREQCPDTAVLMRRLVSPSKPSQ